MSNTDGRTAPPAGARAPARPSLMGGPADAAPGATDTQGVRMLAGLDGSRDDDDNGMKRRTTTAFLALGLAVAGLLVWWMNRPASGDAERVAVVEAPVPTPRPVTEATPPAEPAPPRADEAASQATVAAAPAASAASIEVTAPPPSAPAAVAAAPAASAAAPVRVAKAAPRPAPAPKPRASAAHDPDPLGTFIAQRPKAAVQTASLGAPAAAVRREKSAQDADVELIAALLARVTNEPSVAGPVAAGDQLTIAQIVRRCEARATAEEVAACKRRICEGYWGKADACPKRLAPVAKGAAG